MTKPQSLLSWIGSRVLLSFLSVLAGWGGGMLYCILCALFNSIFHTEAEGFVNLDDGAGVLLLIGLFMGFYILLVWLFVFLPLVLLVPDRSFLWKPGALTLIGFFGGPIIVCISATVNLKNASDLRIYDQNAYLISVLVPFGIPAAIAGGVACFVCAILRRRQLMRNDAVST
ncbi:MAG TPA: hypothetical protein VGZ93_05070 [Candidatus Methylacidiphilales bacterium]|jgi:hypothetical protein|nr:hypothetical protein [Candidatus Methylacidiphilales bacterium]